MRYFLVLMLASLLVFHSCRTGNDDPERYREWNSFGGDSHHTSYSSLNQINRSNVDQLKVAWKYSTGDKGPTIECNPVVIDGVMYVTSPKLKVIALDAESGKEIWRFDPFKKYEGPKYWHQVNRGVTYWKKGNQERIFSAAGPYLFALDAKTGKPVDNFGQDGAVDLRKGVGVKDSDAKVMMTSPGTVYKDLIITGSTVSEGHNSVPGHVQAFNIQTGELEWIFHTIPQPGEFGHDTWEGDSWKQAGGANAWAGMSVDRERGIVYIPTGATAYDFYGGEREGKNLFANTLLALNAETGERIWHQQLVHHGIWDYDLPAVPNLITIDHEGEPTDAVAQITKMGFVFVFNRQNGKPIFPIKERDVPPSGIPGEEAWPTQPFPTKPPPFSRQGFTEGDITDISPEAKNYVKKVLDTLQTGSLYTPGSDKGSIMLPGYLGGGNWSGAAFDPENGMLYVNANNVPSILQIKKAPDSLRSKPGHTDYISTGYHKLVDQNGYPAVKPPWGTLNAIDLNKGEIAWQVPLGSYPELAKKGIKNTGTLNLGGAIVTKGGLVFIGSTLDKKFRAFDKNTGEILWETTLPTGGMALPATYEVNGKQYVVIAAGGGVGQRSSHHHETPPGDTYVAFALP
jgi:quinoprotein glucose dehydrogenase